MHSLLLPYVPFPGVTWAAADHYALGKGIIPSLEDQQWEDYITKSLLGFSLHGIKLVWISLYKAQNFDAGMQQTMMILAIFSVVVHS